MAKPWISKDIFTCIRNKQQLYKSHYLNDSGEERSYYKRYANLLTKIKSAAKKSYFGTQLKLHSNNPAKMWKTLRELLPSKKQHSDAPTSIKINDAIFSDLEQTTHAFNEFFVNVGSDSAQNTSSNYSHTHFLRNRVSSSLVLFSPSPQEVASELKRLKTNKSSSDDQIPMRFITIAADVISPYLSFLIDFMFSNGLFPSILKIAKVIPIFKSGEKQTVNNYRPISLLSPFSKVIEKIIKVRLLSFIARNDILFQRQSGFRKKFTTMFSIIYSVSDCFDNINDKKYSCAIALDIRKAFDSVNRAILLNKLEHYGIRRVCHKLFSGYLENRKQYVCVNNVKSLYKESNLASHKDRY